VADGGEQAQAIYVRRAGEPMRIAFFASGGPGNLHAAFELEDIAPHLIKVAVIVTDRSGIPAIDLARARGVPVIVRDFERECGSWRAQRGSPETEAAYRSKSEAFHDAIAEELEKIEASSGARIDLAVLAYRRIIRGRLLRRFEGKMINQHPADLSVLASSGERAYVGIGGHARAIRSGEGRSRTSTIVVREGIDTGEILCQGPWVPYQGDGSDDSIGRHEAIQKCASDWPSLRFALAAIALGGFGCSERARHLDGSRIVSLFGETVPREGVSCGGTSYLALLAGQGELRFTPSREVQRSRSRSSNHDGYASR
jgi:phosphoribosylglycinamide formyltransferase-1